MTITIRKAVAKDLLAVQAIDKEFFLWACKINHWLNPNYVKKKHALEFNKYFFDKNEVFFIAEDNNKIIGYAEGIIKYNSPKLKIKKVGELESLYIKPEYRGKRLGEKLSMQVLKWFDSKKVNNYKLTVLKTNPKAYALYKKWGFEDDYWTMKKCNK